MRQPSHCFTVAVLSILRRCVAAAESLLLVLSTLRRCVAAAESLLSVLSKVLLATCLVRQQSSYLPYWRLVLSLTLRLFPCWRLVESDIMVASLAGDVLRLTAR